MSTNPKPSKSELTRLKVIAAAIDAIHGMGFNAAHTNRIAEAAGVSWGVLQYHFGDKDGLLQAVLDHIFDGFSASLEEADLAGEQLDHRLLQLIELVWSLVSMKEYRVSVAILRNAGKDESSKIDGQQQVTRWARHTSKLWDKLIADDNIDPQQSEVARHLMFATLRGMADEVNPDSRSRAAMVRQREALAAALSFLMTRDAQQHSRPTV